MEKVVLENKEREELYNKLAEIRPIDQFYYIEKEEEAKLFKSKKYKVEAILKEDVKNYIKSYIEQISKMMEIEVQIEMKEEGEIINLVLYSEQNPILIGKDGKNLESLQMLIRQSVFAQTGFRIKINLDISDYKKKKQKRLEREIKALAHDVLTTKMDVKLDPMNSYDRRIVHSIISEYENLKTESIGEAPNRYVVIRYVD